jgi:hypothetical protein
VANLPANPGEALWIGAAGGQNHANVGIGQGTSNAPNDHEDYSQASIEDGASPPGDPNKFFLSTAGNAVFRINASAGTTSTNTKHPRCECRELQQNGTSPAAWDGRTGTHYLKARVRIIQVTTNRPWICFGQIHGSSNSPNTSDLIRLQTEGTAGTSTNLSLIARRTPPGGSEIRTVLRTGYNVGDWFNYEIWQIDGTITVYIDGVLKLTATGMGQNFNYFKWGCYLQDSLGEGAASGDWGAVEFERGSVKVWHSGYPDPSTPVFTGGTDATGGAGGGASNDTQPPTVPGFLTTVRGNNQVALAWGASTDNIGVDHYNLYRFSASGSAGGDGTSSTLGRAVGGATLTSSSTDKMAVSKFVASAAGTLTAGHFRAWLDASGSTLSKMVVYADSSGAPGSRLAVSDEVTISSTVEDHVQDYVFSGANQITIVSGTTYWVGAAWDDPGTPSLVYSHDGVSAGRTESTATYGTPPSSFGTPSGTFTGPVDAWCDVVAGTGAGTGGGGTSSSFGKTTDGASSSASSADKTAVSKFTATASGTLTAGHARVWMATAGSATVKCVVYANTGGAPGARLAVSDPITVTSTTEAVRDFTFSGSDQIAIASGTDYWLGVAWADPGTPSLTISRDATAGGRQEAASYAPSTFGTPTALTGPIDVYVDVTTGGTAPSGDFVLLTTRTVTNYTNTGLTNGTAYTYAVTAVDAAGNESAKKTAAAVTPGPPDTTAPTVPTGVTATAGDKKVTVSWSASTDADSGMYSYDIWRNGVLIDGVFANTLTYVDNNVVNGTLYSYQIVAVDVSLNPSALSTAATATPAAPAIGGVLLLPAALSSGKVEVAIAWGADVAASSSSWTWTDVTTDVRADPGISTSLGRNDESSRSNPASLTLVLDNSSGDYSLGTVSANYPNVRRGTPVRVRVDPGTGGGRVVFLGYADGFTPSWDVLTGELPVVKLSASGALRRLAQGTNPVMSAYRRATSTTATVKAYWPMEEGSGSDLAPEFFGGGDLTCTGRPDWAANTDFDCSAALPVLKTGAFSAPVTAYTDTGVGQVRFLMSVPDSGGPPDGTVLARFATSGTIGKVDLVYRIVTSGAAAVQFVPYTSGGARIYGADEQIFGPNDPLDPVFPGTPGRLSVEWTQSGGNVSWRISWTDSRPNTAGDLTVLYLIGTITGKTVGIVTAVGLNPLGAKVEAAVGHLTVENAVTNPFAQTSALVAFKGELGVAFPNGRLFRLCTENKVLLTAYGNSGALTAIDQMGPQLVAPLLTLLREIEDADQGQLWDGRNAGLSYSSRRHRAIASAALTVDASGGQLAEGFQAIDDDQRTRNRMTVTRTHGVSRTYEDTTGPLGTAKIGIYDDSITINTYRDTYIAQFARWFVALGTVEGYRYPSVTVDLAASPELAAAVLDVHPGQRIDVTGLDTTLAQFPDASVSLIVEGIAHELTTREWKVTFRCSPWAPWSTGLDGA